MDADSVMAEADARICFHLAEGLAQCPPEQRALFRKMYPDGAPGEKLRSALDRVARTFKKNAARQAEQNEKE